MRRSFAFVELRGLEPLTPSLQMSYDRSQTLYAIPQTP